MVGGDAAVFEAQLPLLKSFSGEVVHVGEIGMGSVAKLVNNMLAFCNAAAAAEALMIGAMAGIDLRKLQQVISNASGNSSAFRNISEKAFKGEFQASFALDLAHKDLRLALELADQLGVPGMIAPQVMNLMRMARAKGMGGDDSSSVIRVYEQALAAKCVPNIMYARRTATGCARLRTCPSRGDGVPRRQRMRSNGHTIQTHPCRRGRPARVRGCDRRRSTASTHQPRRRPRLPRWSVCEPAGSMRCCWTARSPAGSDPIWCRWLTRRRAGHPDVGPSRHGPEHAGRGATVRSSRSRSA